MSSTRVIVYVFALMLVVYFGGIILNELEGVMVEFKPGRGTDFNATVDALVENTWLTYTFLALGILLIGAAYVLRQSGLWGEAKAHQQRRQAYR
jgi:hypothetical protein